ncbi:MAG: hypothetical protein ACF8CQ_10755 [Rhodopirellula sp. JB044]|uniref:hypothetical protein n=1 Tax=Rhodopirellula sp. JB044 TaxID=3342844 RepID=UPI00370CCD8F
MKTKLAALTASLLLTSASTVFACGGSQGYYAPSHTYSHSAGYSHGPSYGHPSTYGAASYSHVPSHRYSGHANHYDSQSTPTTLTPNRTFIQSTNAPTLSTTVTSTTPSHASSAPTAPPAPVVDTEVSEAAAPPAPVSDAGIAPTVKSEKKKPSIDGKGSLANSLESLDTQTLLQFSGLSELR